MKKTVVQKLGTSCMNSYSEALRNLRINLRDTPTQIEQFMALLRIIFSDQNFIMLLEIEGLVTIPNCIARRLKDGSQ